MILCSTGFGATSVGADTPTVTSSPSVPKAESLQIVVLAIGVAQPQGRRAPGCSDVLRHQSYRATSSGP